MAATKAKAGRPPLHPTGEARHHCTFWGTDAEEHWARVFIKRMREREMSVFILSVMRKLGVNVLLDTSPGREPSLIVHNATQSQLEQIKPHKQMILAALQGEAFGVQLLHNQAIWAELVDSYDHCERNISAEVAIDLNRQLIGLMDAFLASIDSVAYMAMPDVMALWVQRRPKMIEIATRINVEVEIAKTGVKGEELNRLVAEIIPSQRVKAPTFDLSVFGIKTEDQ